MHNKETEKFIENELNSEKPNKRVLLEAKKSMRGIRARQTRLYLACGFIGCAVISLICGIVFGLGSARFAESSLSMTETSKNILAGALIAASVIFGIAAAVLIIKYKKRK